MSREEAKTVFLNRGYVEVEGGTIYDADKWRESCRVISEWLEQEPKTGKWILLDECANSGYYCSKCQKKLVKEGWSKTVKKIKYCPNCGAKMEVEE